MTVLLFGTKHVFGRYYMYYEHFQYKKDGLEYRGLCKRVLLNTCNSKYFFYMKMVSEIMTNNVGQGDCSQ